MTQIWAKNFPDKYLSLENTKFQREIFIPESEGFFWTNQTMTKPTSELTGKVKIKWGIFQKMYHLPGKSTK